MNFLLVRETEELTRLRPKREPLVSDYSGACCCGGVPLAALITAINFLVARHDSSVSTDRAHAIAVALLTDALVPGLQRQQGPVEGGQGFAFVELAVQGQYAERGQAGMEQLQHALAQQGAEVG